MKTSAAVKKAASSSPGTRKKGAGLAVATPARATRAVAAGGEAAPWRRDDDDQTMTRELGMRLRAVREERSMSLADLSQVSGVPAPTLSRIENSRMSPTFGVLARIMGALEVDWIDVVGPKKPANADALISFNDASDSKPTVVSEIVRGLACAILHNDDSARLESLLVDVKTQKLADVGGLIGHRGEEFCYVLSGTLALHFEGREPRILRAGGSALFDSSIPHAYLAGGRGGARFLLVVTRSYGAQAPERLGVD